MSKRQLHPLEVNPSTGEPFLRLRSHQNIILTPPRLSDIPLLPPILNDPSVCIWFNGVPYPYTLEHSDSWVKKTIDISQKVLRDLENDDSDSLKVVDVCPVRAIREIKEDGTDVILGDIDITRCQDMDVAASQEESASRSPTELLEINEGRAVGDPEILWTVGDFLAPSHHGRGIMSDVLATLLNDWAIPRMGVRKMVGITFTENHGSRRVFEKNGFVHRTVIKDYKEVKGIMRSLNVLDWSLAA